MGYIIEVPKSSQPDKPVSPDTGKYTIESPVPSSSEGAAPTSIWQDAAAFIRGMGKVGHIPPASNPMPGTFVSDETPPDYSSTRFSPEMQRRVDDITSVGMKSVGPANPFTGSKRALAQQRAELSADTPFSPLAATLKPSIARIYNPGMPEGTRKYDYRKVDMPMPRQSLIQAAYADDPEGFAASPTEAIRRFEESHPSIDKRMLDAGMTLGMGAAILANPATAIPTLARFLGYEELWNMGASVISGKQYEFRGGRGLADVFGAEGISREGLGLLDFYLQGKAAGLGKAARIIGKDMRSTLHERGSKPQPYLPDWMDEHTQKFGETARSITRRNDKAAFINNVARVMGELEVSPDVATEYVLKRYKAAKYDPHTRAKGFRIEGPDGKVIPARTGVPEFDTPDNGPLPPLPTNLPQPAKLMQEQEQPSGGPSPLPPAPTGLVQAPKLEGGMTPPAPLPPAPTNMPQPGKLEGGWPESEPAPKSPEPPPGAPNPPPPYSPPTPTSLTTEATRLGVKFEGVQETPSGPLYQFTDPITETTFYQQTGKSVEESLKEVRDKFGYDMEGRKLVRHYTRGENIPKILDKGFDTKLPPLHGAAGNVRREAFTTEDKIGKDVLYFTTDDERWKKTSVYVGEGKGDKDYTYYDYDKQQWVTEKNATQTVDLSPLQGRIKKDAKILTIDSLEKYLAFQKQTTGEAYIRDAMGNVVEAAKKEGYDVLHIEHKKGGAWETADRAVGRSGEADRYAEVTGNGGKSDYFILNKDAVELDRPDVGEVGGKKTGKGKAPKKSLPKEATIADLDDLATAATGKKFRDLKPSGKVAAIVAGKMPLRASELAESEVVGLQSKRGITENWDERRTFIPDRGPYLTNGYVVVQDEKLAKRTREAYRNAWIAKETESAMKRGAGANLTYAEAKDRATKWVDSEIKAADSERTIPDYKNLIDGYVKEKGEKLTYQGVMPYDFNTAAANSRGRTPLAGVYSDGKNQYILDPRLMRIFTDEFGPVDVYGLKGGQQGALPVIDKTGVLKGVIMPIREESGKIPFGPALVTEKPVTLTAKPPTAKPPTPKTTPTFPDRVRTANTERPVGLLSEFEKEIADRGGEAVEVPQGRRIGIENTLINEAEYKTGKLGGEVRQTGKNKIGEGKWEIDRPYGVLEYDEKTGVMRAVEKAGEKEPVASYSRTASMKANMDTLGPIVMKQIVNSDLAGTIANETVQNSLDAVLDKAIPSKTKEIKVKIEDGVGPDGIAETIVTIQDTGKGMKNAGIEEVILNLGGRAKGGVDDRGGQGLAKGAFVLAPRRTIITTVQNGEKTIVKGTREEFAGVGGAGVDISDPIPTTEPNGTTFRMEFFRRDADARKEGTYGLTASAADTAYNTMVRDRVAVPGVEFTVDSPYSKNTYQSSPLKSRKSVLKPVTIEVNGNKITAHFLPDNGYHYPDYRDQYHYTTEIWNKGMHLAALDGAVDIEAGLKKPKFKIALDIERSVDPRNLDYPFNQNRTTLTPPTIQAIKSALNPTISDIHNKAYEKEVGDFTSMIDNAPTIGGVKVMIPFLDKAEAAKAKKLIEKNKDLVEGLANIFTSFQALLGKVGHEIKNLSLTVDPGVHGWHSNPRATGHEFYAINPFAATDSYVSGREYADLIGRNFEPVQLQAANLSHTLMHEFTHTFVSKHNENFTSTLATLYARVGHEQLARLDREGRAFYEQYGEKLASLQNDFRSMGEGGSRFRSNDLRVSPGDIHPRGGGDLLPVEAGSKEGVRPERGGERSAEAGGGLNRQILDSGGEGRGQESKAETKETLLKRNTGRMEKGLPPDAPSPDDVAEASKVSGKNAGAGTVVKPEGEPPPTTTLHSNPLKPLADFYTEKIGKPLVQAILKHTPDSVKEFWSPTSTLADRDLYLAYRGKARGMIDRAESMIKREMAAFDSYTRDQKRDMFNALDDPSLRPALPPDQLQRVARVARINDAIGRQLVSAGLLSKETFEANKGRYIHYMYLKHALGDGPLFATTGGKLDMSIFKPRKDMTKAEREAIGLIEDIQKAQTVSMSKGLYDVAMVGYFNKVKERWAWKPPTVETVGIPQSFDNLRAAEARLQYLNRRAGGQGYVLETKPGTQRSFVIRDIRSGALVPSEWRIGDLAKEIELQKNVVEQSPTPETTQRLQILETAMQRAQQLSGQTTPPKGFKQMPDTAAYGPLKGEFVPVQIWRDIVPLRARMQDPDEYGRGFNFAADVVEEAMTVFKMTKTALNIPTMTRNAVSNLVQLNMSGIPLYEVPVWAARGLKEVVSAKGQYYTLAKRNGVFKTNWAEGEIAEVMRTIRKGGTTDGFSPWSMVRNLASYYGKIDDVYKAAKFMERMESPELAGLAVEKRAEAAAREAQKWVMDYSLMPRSVKALRRLAMPFVSYQQKILPLIAQSMIEQPWVLGKYLLIPAIMQAATQQHLNISDEEFNRLKSQLPMWLQRNQSYVPLPMRSPEGNMEWVNMEYFFPAQQVMALARDAAAMHGGEMFRDLGFGGPLMNIVTLLNSTKGTNPPKDPYTGKEIWNRLDPPQNKLALLTQWLYNQWAPSMLTEFGTLGQAIKAGAHAYNPALGIDRYGKAVTPGQAAASLVGVNVVSPTPAQAARERRAIAYQLKSSLVYALRDNPSESRRKQLVEKYGKDIKELYSGGQE